MCLDLMSSTLFFFSMEFCEAGGLSSKAVMKISTFVIIIPGIEIIIPEMEIIIPGITAQDSYHFRGCSIHHTFNRAVTVHGVDNLLVKDNVAFHNMGHAYFLEDGIFY